MKALLLAVSMVLSLAAATLDAVIGTALINSPSLQSIGERIAASEEAVALAARFDNPVLALGVNDIHPGDISDRSIERMQSTSVTLKQRIPFFGKRAEKERAARAGSAFLSRRLDEAKATLAAAIRSEAFQLWKAKQLLEIETRYAALMRRDAELFRSYNITSSGGHMGIMATELALSTSAVTRASLQTAIAERLARLSYLAGTTVDGVDLELTIGAPPDLEPLRKTLENNFALKASGEAVEERKARLAHARLQRYPDPTVGVGYFRREAFEDYVSVTLSVPLPLYGTEARQTQIAEHRLLEEESAYADLALSVRSDFEHEAARLTGSYERCRILEEESLPRLEHMFELAAAAVDTGSDLKRYIDLLEQKLQLEKARIGAIADYHTAYARLRALTGVIR
jgi:outer membrane protein TolC